MNIFIARQPIFTKHKTLYAYELLYRGKKETSLPNDESGNKAAKNVLFSEFLAEGLESISDSRPCFISFTRDLLLQDIPAAFPKSQVIVEVHENVALTPDILAICRKLKDEGYTIALDGFVYDPGMEPFVRIADIVKMDYPTAPNKILRESMDRLSEHKVKLLAKKVHSYDDFAKANRMGFTYFQGYFFCQPEKNRKAEIDSSKVSLVRLLAEINSKTTTRQRVVEIIQGDVTLSYKILKYINSSYFYRLNKIDSVPHAIAYLGDVELRRFVILMLISSVGSDKPSEALRLALVRAKMVELLAKETELNNKADEIFLLGLFSLLSALLDTTMDKIAEQLSLSDQLKDCLVSKSGPYAPYLEVVTSYEKRDEIACLAAVKKIDVTPGTLHQFYMEAIKFTQSVLA